MRWACWVGLLAVLQLLAPALCKRHMPNLLEDDTSKKVVRAAECTFGGIGRELGSTWFADLGPPFGVMYCIKCDCIPVHKKRRIVAKVQCRNIKNECPKPSCEEPVLHPGRCCKTCPGDLHSPDTPPQDLPQMVTAEEEEKDARHFAALLTGVGRSPAAIRFVLRRRSLHFSVENGLEPALLLRVLDSAGSILQEIPLAAGGTLAGRGCGAWRRLPREYRKMLRDGKLTAALLWPGETDATLTGPIVSHNALSTEMFSALLESDPASSENGWGGTAAISVSAGAASSVHITVLFTGLLAGEHELDAPVRVTLEMVDKNTTILEEFGHIKKPSNEMNIVEFSAAVNSSDLRLLARGRLSLFLRAARPGATASQSYLRGPALLKLACDVFHAPLAAAPRSPLPPASGVACLHLNRDGDLIYTIQVDELNMLESPMITLIDEANKHKEETELTPYLRDGLANGSFYHMGPRLLESLYSGDLVVNVATHSDRSVIRGRIISRPVADIQDLQGPTLMKRPDLTQPADIVGLAWISVDYECSVQWEISIAGPLASSLILSDLELWLDMRPMLVPGAPVISKRLGLLETPEGAMLSPALIDLQRLHSGACEVIVRDLKTNTTLLHSTLKQMKIPDSCLPKQWSNNEVPPVSYLPASQHPNSADNSLGDSCFHSGSFYEDGAQWTSANEPCKMCSCQHLTVKCDAYRCPPLSCGAKAMIKPGECCPTCSNSSLQDANTSSTKGCYQVGQFHPAGQSWHPYLPPSGFDTCAICTCEGNPLKVQCTRVSCPFLACSEKQAYRQDKKSCCKRCPEIKPEVVDRTVLGDEGSQSKGGLASRLSPEEVLAAGGCRYPLGGPLHNGMEWHPTVHSHGEQKCVTCRCKDGEIKCDRKRCTRSVCNSQLNQRRRAGAGHKGAPKPPPDECCQQHCRRYRRHQRHHRSGARP